MRIAVIGAGIAGVTTAYELARDGHEISVMERNDAVAAQASFANAGLLSSALAGLAPVPMRRHLLGRPSALEEVLRWRPRWQRAEWHWLRRWQVIGGRAEPGQSRALLHLAELSRQRQQAMIQEHRLSHERSEGLLILHREGSRADRRWLRLRSEEASGLRIHAVDAARCRQIEPGLNSATALAGGLHLPDAEVGNCREFAHQLRLVSERGGSVRFYFNAAIKTLHSGPDGPVLILARPADRSSGRAGARPRQPGPVDQGAFLPTQPQPLPGELTFDAVVLCTGAHAHDLWATAGVHLPLLPVWGQSATFRLRDDLHEQVLRSAVIEADSGITLTRMGQRLRVSGGWELGGPVRGANDTDFEPLYAALDRWFPLATQRAGAQLWRGERPMLPHGTPVIGPAAMPGVWLQLGLGAHGWTLACGAARLLADQIGGRACAIDPAPFSAQRWTAQ